MDLISRAKAIDAIDEIESEIAEGFGFEYEKWRKYFCDLPPAQPERIKGRWTRDNACSECGCQPWFSGDIHNYNFCPNCGAEMEVTT